MKAATALTPRGAPQQSCTAQGSSQQRPHRLQHIHSTSVAEAHGTAWCCHSNIHLHTELCDLYSLIHPDTWDRAEPCDGAGSHTDSSGHTAFPCLTAYPASASCHYWQPPLPVVHTPLLLHPYRDASAPGQS